MAVCENRSAVSNHSTTGKNYTFGAGNETQNATEGYLIDRDIAGKLANDFPEVASCQWTVDLSLGTIR
jgi:hypothetical protein